MKNLILIFFRFIHILQLFLCPLHVAVLFTLSHTVSRGSIFVSHTVDITRFLTFPVLFDLRNGNNAIFSISANERLKKALFQDFFAADVFLRTLRRISCQCMPKKSQIQKRNRPKISKTDHMSVIYVICNVNNIVWTSSFVIQLVRKLKNAKTSGPHCIIHIANHVNH